MADKKNVKDKKHEDPSKNPKREEYWQAPEPGTGTPHEDPSAPDIASIDSPPESPEQP